jgi:hypothetical protein
MSQRFEASDLLTFAETDYFDVFDQSGSIFNYTFGFSSGMSFLFIGLSMKDMNCAVCCTTRSPSCDGATATKAASPCRRRACSATSRS